jgi:RNA polymerase sigma factor (sigma-70 family)
MDDPELLEGCFKGNKQSWNEFHTRFSRLIYHYIHNVLKTKNCDYHQEDVSDIFQVIFRLLIKDDCKKLRSYSAKNGCSLASWLRLVTINCTLDYLRKLKQPLFSIDDDGNNQVSFKDRLQDNSALAVDLLSKEEKLVALKDCIDVLAVDDQYFLELFLNQSLKLEQLRRHLKLSRGAVDMRKSRIFKRLADCFRSKGFALDFKD